MQFSTISSSSFVPARIEVQLSEEDVSREGTWFTRVQCEESLLSMFGVRPTWSRESFVNSTHRNDHPESAPTGIDALPYLDKKYWASDRRRWRSNVPVVGWLDDSVPPGEPAESVHNYLRTALGHTPSVDVRLRASANVCRTFTGKDYAGHWTRFRTEDMTVRAFLHSIDFLVASGENAPLSRTTMEALTSGCLIIAPEAWRTIYGDAVIYAEPEGVISIIGRFYSDRAEYERQLTRGYHFADRNTAHSLP